MCPVHVDRVSGERFREVIFEITRVGDVQRVAAIDVATGVEVVMQAPAQCGVGGCAGAGASESWSGRCGAMTTRRWLPPDAAGQDRLA